MACYVHAPTVEKGCTDCTREQQRLDVVKLCQEYGYKGDDLAGFLRQLIVRQADAIAAVHGVVQKLLWRSNYRHACIICGALSSVSNAPHYRGCELEQLQKIVEDP